MRNTICVTYKHFIKSPVEPDTPGSTVDSAGNIHTRIHFIARPGSGFTGVPVTCTYNGCEATAIVNITGVREMRRMWLLLFVPSTVAMCLLALLTNMTVMYIEAATLAIIALWFFYSLTGCESTNIEAGHTVQINTSWR